MLSFSLPEILRVLAEAKVVWGSSEEKVKRKPDFILILLAVFGLGVVITLLAPMSSTQSVAEPASALQAGVFTESLSQSPD